MAACFRATEHYRRDPLALGCGLVASIGISQVMDRNGHAQAKLETVPIYVAVHNINLGDPIDGDAGGPVTIDLPMDAQAGRGFFRLNVSDRDQDQDGLTDFEEAVIGTSPGKIGTAIGQQHLRSILGFCNSPQMNAMEAYIQFEKGLITEDGTVTNESTEKFLRKYMEEFHAFIERVYTVLPRNG